MSVLLKIKPSSKGFAKKYGPLYKNTNFYIKPVFLKQFLWGILANLWKISIKKAIRRTYNLKTFSEYFWVCK